MTSDEAATVQTRFAMVRSVLDHEVVAVNQEPACSADRPAGSSYIEIEVWCPSAVPATVHAAWQGDAIESVATVQSAHRGVVADLVGLLQRCAGYALAGTMPLPVPARLDVTGQACLWDPRGDVALHAHFLVSSTALCEQDGRRRSVDVLRRRDTARGLLAAGYARRLAAVVARDACLTPRRASCHRPAAPEGAQVTVRRRGRLL